MVLRIIHYCLKITYWGIRPLLCKQKRRRKEADTGWGGVFFLYEIFHKICDIDYFILRESCITEMSYFV